MRGHLDDLASDFSAIHRVDDIRALAGPAFFRLAFRLGAYQGVIAARVIEQQQREVGPAAGQWEQAGSWGGAGREPAAGTRQNLEAMQAQLQAQAPGAPQLFSFSTSKHTG